MTTDLLWAKETVRESLKAKPGPTNNPSVVCQYFVDCVRQLLGKDCTGWWVHFLRICGGADVTTTMVVRENA